MDLNPKTNKELNKALNEVTRVFNYLYSADIDNKKSDKRNLIRKDIKQLAPA